VTEPENGTTVRITLKDVYSLVQEVQKDLSKGLGQMESHVAQPNHAGTQGELTDHEQRIRKLEKVAWAALGIAVVVEPALAIFFYIAQNQ
jgi:hypothetical protein